jgi:hypothetical protein
MTEGSEREDAQDYYKISCIFGWLYVKGCNISGLEKFDA